MKIQWHLLIPGVVVAVITGLILLNPIQQAQPIQIDENLDAASVHIAATTDRVVFPGQCVMVTWALEGIREVYLNGQGKVGQGEVESCLVGRPPLLRVVFQNGETKEYVLPVTQSYATPLGLIALLAFVAALCVVVGSLFGSQALLVLLTVVIFAPLLRSQVNLGQDYVDHNMFAAVALDNPNALPPHFLYHIATLALHQTIPALNIENASFVVMLLAYVVTALATFHLLRWLNRQGGQVELSPFVWAAATVCLMLIGPISVFEDILRPNQRNAFLFANTYHNPTISMLKPFAVLLCLVVLKLLRKPKRRVVLLAIAAAILMVLATLAKPNYTLAIVPALMLVIAYSFVRPLPINRIWIILGVLVPAGLVLLWQFNFLYGAERASLVRDDSASIIFAPFDYYMNYGGVPFGWLLVDLAASVAFPALVYAIYWREARFNMALNLSWLVFLIALAQAYLFNESPAGNHGNLTWGTQIALFILFAVSLEWFIRKVTPVWRNRHLPRWQDSVLALVFLAHLINRVIVLLPGNRF